MEPRSDERGDSLLGKLCRARRLHSPLRGVGLPNRIPTPKDVDGISILSTLLGQQQTKRHEFLYWEFHENGFKQAVRMGEWKAVRFGVDGPIELYNLKNDIGETKNVAEQNPQIVAKIADYLKTARTEDPNWPTKTAAETPHREYEKEPFDANRKKS